MDDLEQAILICLDPAAEPSVQARALQYCHDIQQSPSGLSFALAHIKPSTRPEVTFWCLQLIHQAVSLSLFSSNPPSHGPAQVARQSVLDFATAVTTTHAATNPQPNFVRNKIAQLVAAFVAADYPDGWPDAMRKFILPLASDESKRTLGSLDLFFRVLRALDDDVTSIHAAQRSESARLISVRVKDAIRLDCTQEFVEILATLVTVPAYLDHAYDLVARNVEWLDIGLFANDSFLQGMYSSITSAVACPSRAASAFALRAILSKRMPDDSKLALLKHLQVILLLSSIPLEIPGDEAGLSLDVAAEKLSGAELSIQSGRREVASLVNCVAMSALDILKNLLQGKQTLANVSQEEREVIQNSCDIAQAALPLALRFGSVDVEEAGPQDALQCVTAYMSTFRRLNALFEQQANGGAASTAMGNGLDLSETWSWGREGIAATLDFIEEKACFPPDYDPMDDEHPFVALRHILLKSVLRNIARSAPSMVLTFVRRVATHPGTVTSVPRTELVLSMLAILAESSPEVPGLTETLIGVMSNPPIFPSNASHELEAASHQLDAMSIAHFDLVARCYRVILTSQDPNLLVSVLAPFFDSRGLRHPTSVTVRSRAAYLLLKVTRPLRTFITVRHLADVMNAIQPLLFPVQAHDAGLVFSDQMNLFETAGYLVGTDTTRAESIAYLRNLLNTLIDSLQNATTNIQKIGIVTAAGQLSKGFGGDSKPLLLLAGSVGSLAAGSSSPVHLENIKAEVLNGKGAKDENAFSPSRTEAHDEADVKVQKPPPVSQESLSMWASLLEVVLKSTGFMETDDATVASPLDFVSNGELIEKVMFVLHRMIDTIGPGVVPHLNIVLRLLLQGSSSAPQVRGVVVLASQAVGKFASSFETVIAAIFPGIVTRVNQFPAVIDSTTMLAMSEESREAVELHKAYFYLIHAILSNDISQVFLVESNARHLGDVVSALLVALVGDTIDLRAAPTVMKMCTASLARMVALWIPAPDEQRQADSSLLSGPAGFREFVVNEVAPACVRSGVAATLFQSGDYSNGSAVAVLTENVSLQRTCASRIGPSFGESMGSLGFRGVQGTDISAYIRALYQQDITVQSLTKEFTSILKRLRKSHASEI
jgi:hypothetical protein